jgi:hypothetical protein
MVLVKPPAAKPPQQVVEEDGDEFQLSEPIERPDSSMLQIDLEKIERELDEETEDYWDGSPPKPMQEVIREQTRGWLDRARAEGEKRKQTAATRPARGLSLSGIFTFLADPQAVFRLILLACMLTVIIWILKASMILGVITVFPLSLIFLGLASVQWLAILQDTANGEPRVQNWPGAAFFDWMMEIFYVVNCIFVSGTPGVLLGQLLACGGASPLASVFVGLITIYALFPVLLLSTLEEGSPIGMASAKVWTSLITAYRAWAWFYLISAGLLLLAAGSLLLLLNAPFFLLQLLVAAVPALISMLYFRLLGRLDWCLAEPTPDEDAG